MSENKSNNNEEPEYKYKYISISIEERKKEKYSQGKTTPFITLYVSSPNRIIHDKLIDVLKREGRSISSFFWEQAERYVAVHSEGNPQLTLTKFSKDLEAKKTCFRCQGHFPRVYRVQFISGLVAPVCNECLEHERLRGVVKKVLGK